MKPAGDTWGICFSRLGKILVGAVAALAGLVATGVGAVVSMTWDNSRTLDTLSERTQATWGRVVEIDHNVDDARERISRLEGAAGQK